MIKYTDNTDDITVEQLAGYFVGWPNPPSPATHLKLLKRSYKIVLAIDDASGMVVGFVNAISDGVLAAYIPLLEVLPNYQKRGIGQGLMQRLLGSLRDFYMIDLICERKLESYYRRFDMAPAFGMVIRNFDRQSGCD